uniref:ORF8 n=1 Tax=Lymantria dispar multicapsid nuclear polyhedrosis virus TaxID=10449 RepID=A0A2S1XBR6_NPVLD|nr:ORF8 [Lymantria dispar multiple nucleopolyhedrovirus]
MISSVDQTTLSASPRLSVTFAEKQLRSKNNFIYILFVSQKNKLIALIYVSCSKNKFIYILFVSQKNKLIALIYCVLFEKQVYLIEHSRRRTGGADPLFLHCKKVASESRTHIQRKRCDRRLLTRIVYDVEDALHTLRFPLLFCSAKKSVRPGRSRGAFHELGRRVRSYASAGVVGGQTRARRTRKILRVGRGR